MFLGENICDKIEHAERYAYYMSINEMRPDKALELTNSYYGEIVCTFKKGQLSQDGYKVLKAYGKCFPSTTVAGNQIPIQAYPTYVKYIDGKVGYTPLFEIKVR